jgi:hypothetical protein
MPEDFLDFAMFKLAAFRRWSASWLDSIRAIAAALGKPVRRHSGKSGRQNQNLELRA